MSTVVADQRFVAGAAGSALFTFTDADGEPATPGATPTAVVTRVSTGATVTVAASVAAVSGSTGLYSLSLTAAELGADLDRFTVEWSVSSAVVGTTTIELTGRVYFTTSAAYERFPKEVTEDKYEAADVVAARQAVESEFEAICDRGFVPRFGSFEFVGNGSTTVILPCWDVRQVLAVYSVSNAGVETAFTSAALTAILARDYGALIRLDGNCWVDGYRYRACVAFGLDVPPREVLNAALDRLRWHLGRPQNNTPTKAKTFTSGESGGTYGLAQASATKTGNDDIDAVLARWRRHEIGVA